MLLPNDPLVKEYFRRIIGEEGLKIIENIPEGEGITDEEIANLSKVKLTEVRKTLYALYENRMAEYRTERDDESGWITYYWKFNLDNVKKIIEEEIEKVLRNLRAYLEYEQGGVFYACKCRRVLFEEAAESGFRCDVCGCDYEFFDNSEVIKAITEKIAEIERWRKRKKKG
ncbi:MAG: transcription factor [Candidatus Methanospirareceae archaeon]